jgi:hypothetical protein
MILNFLLTSEKKAGHAVLIVQVALDLSPVSCCFCSSRWRYLFISDNSYFYRYIFRTSNQRYSEFVIQEHWLLNLCMLMILEYL